MPDNALFVFDGSPLSERALIYALETFPDATITTLYAINPVDSVIDVEAGGLPVAEDWYDDAQERATRVTRRLRSSRQSRVSNSILSQKS
jgi:hypothetical protein